MGTAVCGIDLIIKEARQITVLLILSAKNMIAYRGNNGTGAYPLI